MQKHPNLIFKLVGDVGWHIGCVNIFYSFSMDRTLNFLIDLPRLAMETWSVALSATTLTWWCLASINILNGNVGALPDSTTCCCFVNLLMPRIND